MRPINRILVSVDGSSSAQNATEYAIALAKQLNADLELIHVVRHAVGNMDAGILPMEAEENEKQNAIRLIEHIKKQHPNIHILHFEPIGLPHREIEKTIRAWNADLLVIGHHTHGFLERLLMDSVERDLLRHLNIPLLIVPEQN